MQENVGEAKLSEDQDDIENLTADEAVEVNVVLVVDILAEKPDQQLLLLLLVLNCS